MVFGWLFGSDDDGCSGHHFGEWHSEGMEFRREHTVSGYKWKERQHRKCQHEGCYEEETMYRTVATSDDDFAETISNLTGNGDD